MNFFNEKKQSLQPWSSHGYPYHISASQFRFDNQSTDLLRGSAIGKISGTQEKGICT